MAERKSYLLRLPVKLMDHLAGWAKDDLRSLNAQIEFLLREAVCKRRGIHVSPSSAANTESSPPAPPSPGLPASGTSTSNPSKV